ncbi:MAG: glycosyltransferase family 2 protein [Clostridia bacterium]|nr:glycosyltransferase family 2 protein [Clostridia bacterium]
MPDYKAQIIVPVYNSSKTLKKCLDSIQAQSYKLWQAILVDDKSSDNSPDILNTYAKADSRFVVVSAEKNGGSSAARNLAMELLDAEYTAFLDSDDYWEADMLETLVSKAEEHSCDIVQCRFIYDFPGGRRFLPAGAFDRDVFLEGKALRRVYMKMMTGINMNHVCMKLIRTSLIKELRFDTTLPTAEDLDFCVRAFKTARSYYFSSAVMYHYCRWESSLTGRGMPFKTRLNANRRVSRVMVEMLPHWGVDNMFYKALALMRPYIIVVSKVIRIAREKLLTK